MQKKGLLKIGLTGLILAAAMFLPTALGVRGHVAQAAGAVELNVTRAQIEAEGGGAKGARIAIKNALSEAAAKASKNNPYRVTVEPGEYVLDSVLYVGSNTTLVLDGVTLRKGSGDMSMIRIGMEGDFDQKTGYEYKNITITGGQKGGTLEGEGVTGTFMPVGHAENVTVENMTFHNGKNCHMLELGGVNNVTVKNCTFRDLALSEVGTDLHYEALQLDILQSKCFEKYKPEVLATKNITVNGCTFENVPRGVGNHSDILNLPMSNIRITGCTFSNLPSCAIQGQNWKNSIISGNTITGTPRGIAIYSRRDMGEGSYKPNQITSNTPVSSGYQAGKNDNITISNNTIKLNTVKDKWATDVLHDSILVYGGKVTSSPQDKKNMSGGIPKGDYYLTNVVVRDNTITTSGNGIRVMNARAASIEANKISYGTSANEEDNFGIQAGNGCREVVISGNTVTKAKKKGISVNNDSKAKKITSNTITGTHNGMDLLMVYDHSSASAVSGNKIGGKMRNGILVSVASAVGTISKNEINKDGKGTVAKSGIFVDGSEGKTESKITQEIRENIINNPRERGIAIMKASVKKSIHHNTITGAKKEGIQLYDQAEVGVIEKNTIKFSGSYGIMVNKKSAVNKIKNNTMSQVKGGVAVNDHSKVKRGISSNRNITSTNPAVDAIMVYNYSSASSVSGNRIKGKMRNGIMVGKGSTAGTISKNEINKDGKGTVAKSGIFVDGTGGKTKTQITREISENIICKPQARGIVVQKATVKKSIRNNKITNSKQEGIFLYCSAKAASIEKNTIKSSGANGILLNLKSTVNKISGNSISKAKGGAIKISKDSKAGGGNTKSVKSKK